MSGFSDEWFQQYEDFMAECEQDRQQQMDEKLDLALVVFNLPLIIAILAILATVL